MNLLSRHAVDGMICSMATFGEWLDAELKSRKMKPAELARRAKLDPGAVSRILKSERNPGPITLEVIAKALKLPYEVVFRAAVGKTAPTDPTEAEYEEDLARAEHMLRSFKTEQYRQIALATLEALLVQEEKGGYSANGLNPATSQPKP